ncbi:Lrp/AsnC family transcriptional regulator [Allorhizobium sp. BGMRC 0089]|uniref:Lrp/AsnC family transcriptional regulator n=1 Tax=Allorhizobium sonneratiae TaxID=2934936 RepID=UPI0020342534|nr:Lrp/AsnC family transcriptional regulator [Allorhizobium sonneratiae]MCM2294012.1 Lrp/AsnC family transcriptional regulator [Allorhizobium sonneratiae]
MLDLIDRKIIAELQQDATLSVAQLGERVGLSATPCWKRVQRLEQNGVILGRVALVAPEPIGLGLTVFVAIEATDHSPAWRKTFADNISAMPEVMEVHRMAGEVDYMLRVAVADMTAYDLFYQRLTESVPLKNVTSHFAMERIAAKTAYPVDITNR